MTTLKVDSPSDVQISANLKPQSASFTSLQISDSFNHYRSVSYFEAIANLSSSTSYKSGIHSLYPSDQQLEQKHRIPSCSTPCTPKRIEIKKYSTLPTSNIFGLNVGSKKTKSSSLSSFFKKLKPKFHRSSSSVKNPWIVIELSNHSKDCVSYDDSDRSDHSFELAARTKEQHFTSLKDLNENTGSDVCKCLQNTSKVKSKTSETSLPKCSFFNVFNVDNKNSKCQSSQSAKKCKSESSVFYKLSHRKQFEDIKNILKGFRKKKKCEKCSSFHSLSQREDAGKATGYLKVPELRAVHKSSSCASQLGGNGEGTSASSSVLIPATDFSSSMRECPPYNVTSGLHRSQFYRSTNNNLLCQSRYSSQPRRSQPPKTLSLPSKVFDSHVEQVFTKMASVESIGACSLDLEASTSTGACLVKDSANASEYTLQSDITESYVNGSGEGESSLPVENGHDAPAEKKSSSKVHPNVRAKKPVRECTVAEIKLPSYVSISCAINGYTNYSKFCRSRENSPARTSFRKTSLESNVLETNQDMTDRLQVSNFRCTRSHSDCNGAINSIFTESRQVTVSKQLQIPVKSTKRYMTAHEIIIGEEGSISHKKGEETPVNGHSEKGVSLAQEVGDGGPKSLVQQRIESLYGQHELKSYSHRVSRRSDHHHLNGKTENVPVSKRSPSCPPSTRGKTGNNLPVFRHLTKDFRKQLQGDISEPSDFLDTECSSGSNPKPDEPVENVLTKKEEDSSVAAESESETMKMHEQECNNGLEQLPNGHGIDECDRAVSAPHPQPKPTFNNLVKPSSLTDIVSAPVCDKEGYRFLDIMDVERREIEREIKKAEDYLENSDVPEDACGKIRAACGKANLLLSQKFEQFKELCMKNINENHTDQFYTTASDLAGFWDMVMLQVTDVKNTFQDIQALKENNWKEVSSAQASPLNPKPKKHASQNISKSNPCTPKRSAKSAEMARAREEARKQLLAAKKKGRQQNTNQDENEIAIFVPSNSS